jgi:CheY-like chemotaxis protein
LHGACAPDCIRRSSIGFANLDHQAGPITVPRQQWVRELVNEQAMNAAGSAGTEEVGHHSTRQIHRVPIFVIDDHLIMRDAIVSVIRRLSPDAHIHEFGCLAELPSAAVLQHPPGAVVLDLKLPDAVGCSGVLHIKRNYPGTPLAVCSASPSSEMATKCIDAGADLYIQKGAGSSKLTTAISALLAMSLITTRGASDSASLRVQGLGAA